MDAWKQTTLFGMTIDAVALDEAARIVLGWARDAGSDACRYVVTPNVDHAIQFQENSALRAAYADASLVVADGAPVIAAARLLGRALPGRVAGSDLVPALFALADEAYRRDTHCGRLRVFLLGAGPGVAERAARCIHARWPGVEVVGVYSPPMGFERDAAERRRINAQVNSAGAEVLLIGLGAPKQELWIADEAAALDVRAALCIGATIDFLAGEKSRAPRWMQRAGLEWLHRMLSEPRRLVKRYARDAWIFPRLLWREWRHGGAAAATAPSSDTSDRATRA